jgi:RHS repeat-associated protein
MPHLASIGWDHRDQMVSADKGGGGMVYFTYNAAGQRVRKVYEHNGLIEERIYLGGWEVYRKRQGGAVVLERETLHAMDGERRIALVETKTIDADAPPFTPTPRLRYQLGNHLGSAVLELDEAGQLISYEEYHPYGTTAYHATTGDLEVSAKRYRYTGKERDEETGLYYHGARYYAPWLGRWTSTDAAGMTDGPGLYNYARGSPVRLRDPDGRQSVTSEDVNQRIAQMTDAQLHSHVKGLSAEDRASFAGAATGKFAQRAWAMLDKYHMERIYTLLEVKIEGSVERAQEPSPKSVEQKPTTIERSHGMVDRESRAILEMDDYLTSPISAGIYYGIYRPIKSWIEDKPQSYLDSNHNVRESTVHRDHSHEMAPALGQAVLLGISAAQTIKAALPTESVYIPTDKAGKPIPLAQQTIKGRDIPLPDPEAQGPHTVLGGKVSTATSEPYRQSATFPSLETWPSAEGKPVPWSRVDWGSHGRADHPVPHQHIFTYDPVQKKW